MDRFIKYVLPYVPGCPYPLIKTQVLLAANEFCRESYIWERKCEYQIGEAYTDMGTVGDPSYYEPLKFVYDDDGIVITPSDPYVDVVDVALSVDDVALDDYILRGNIVLFETPPEDGTVLEAKIYLSPSDDATSLPDFLFKDWRKGIVSGALAELMMMPGKPWSNPGGAQARQQAFLHYIGEAKITHHRKNLQVLQKMQLRPWI
jgi:hypothetical protein